MATETAVALDSNFKLLLMSRILVAVEKMVASCYNRDQTWLCLYCWCQTPSGVVSPRGDYSGCALVIGRRGETTPSGVWHQEYTHNHVWSLNQQPWIYYMNLTLFYKEVIWVVIPCYKPGVRLCLGSYNNAFYVDRLQFSINFIWQNSLKFIYFPRLTMMFTTVE